MDKLSQPMEDYLKTIYLLQADSDGGTSTNALADALSVTPASVTSMIKRLVDLKLVRHTPYQAIALTKTGEKVALEIVRHHRLLELYLYEALGYEWDKVHAEADELEHVISEEFEERIAAKLGNPLIDPHGDPIPTKDGALVAIKQQSLLDLEIGQSARITRVSDRDPEMLRYAARLGLRPSTRVKIIQVEPFGGSLQIKVGGVEHSIGRELAAQIFVAVE
ncbi:MAG TPA: metal-dependent transcriptional regulator [Anaerolineae bacterium]|nr:metal-dependent transcriptional regulator [Anaerolineae bacterium]